MLSFKLANHTHLGVLLTLTREYYLHDGHKFCESKVQGALKEIFNNSTLGKVWMIAWNEEMVGYLILTFGFSVEFGGRDAFVDEFYIREAYRSKGLGRKAIGFVEETAKKLGVKAIHLEVNRNNKNAQEVYRKLDFQDRDYYLMTRLLE
ncbi:MAG: GNAT family N-acetyltransferase [Verrucomicrobiia bacterium]